MNQIQRDSKGIYCVLRFLSPSAKCWKMQIRIKENFIQKVPSQHKLKIQILIDTFRTKRILFYRKEVIYSNWRTGDF